MSALDTYREWERSNPSTMMLLFTIERDDQSAAKRLTITNKPYYDAGSGGAKYHDTYPAPVNCIINDSFVIDTQIDGTRIDSLTLLDVDGDLAPILTQYNMVSHRITGYIGDQNWSMMETALPYRFEKIVIGEVEFVEPGIDQTITIRIKVDVRNLRKRYVTDGRPLAIGECFNVPLKLISASALEYAYSSIEQYSTSNDMAIYDNGVALTYGVGYNTTLESSVYKGKVTLTAARAGVITGHINKYASASLYVDYPRFLYYAAGGFIKNEIMSGYSLKNSTTLSVVNQARSICVNSANTKGFYLDSNETVYRYSITSSNFNTASEDGAPYRLDLSAYNDPWGICLADDNVTFCFVERGTATLYVGTLGTASDVATVGAFSSKVLTSIDAAINDPYSVRISSDRMRLFVGSGPDIYQLDFGTAGVPSTLTYSGVKIKPSENFLSYGYSSNVVQFDIGNSGRSLIVVNAHIIQEIELTTAYDLASAYYTPRSYWTDQNRTVYGLCYSKSGSKIYHGDSVQSKITQLDLTDNYQLKPHVLRFNNSGMISREGGVFFESETDAQTILREILTGLFCSYTIDEFGAFHAILLRDSAGVGVDPGNPFFVLEKSDCIGISESYASLVSTQGKASAYYGRGKRNYRVLSDNEIGGVVTNADRAAFQAEWVVVSETGLATDYANAETVTVDTSLCPTVTTGTFAEYKAIVNTERVKFRMKIALGTFGYHSSFELGRQVRINFENPFIAEGSAAMIVGLAKDYIQRTMDVTFDRQV